MPAFFPLLAFEMANNRSGEKGEQENDKNGRHQPVHH
jgi:hypothetical protein